LYNIATEGILTTDKHLGLPDTWPEKKPELQEAL